MTFLFCVCGFENGTVHDPDVGEIGLAVNCGTYQVIAFAVVCVGCIGIQDVAPCRLNFDNRIAGNEEGLVGIGCCFCAHGNEASLVLREVTLGDLASVRHRI